MAKSKKPTVDRRNFLKTVAAGAGAASLAGPAESLSAEPVAPRSALGMPLMPPMIETDPPASAEVLTVDRSGSDYMVDIMKYLGFEYVCSVAGSSFRGLHESVINYGGNKNPEVLTCCHEESSVAMGHGYAKIEGKPMLALLHGTIGVQHAAMAIYNAYGDRVPVVMIAGTGDTAVPANTAVDLAVTVRDYVKW